MITDTLITDATSCCHTSATGICSFVASGCYDHEDQAAKAYDKMMLWCELHNAAGLKSGITNFAASEYEKDVPMLSTVTQVCGQCGHTSTCAWMLGAGKGG